MKTTVSVQRAWLTGEILGYLRVLRDVCKWNDDPMLDKHIAKLEAMKKGEHDKDEHGTVDTAGGGRRRAFTKRRPPGAPPSNENRRK